MLALALGALACASDAGGGRTVLAKSQSQAVVVLPLNMASGVPAELADGSERFWTALLDALRAQTPSLKTLARSDARAMWRSSVAEARVAAGDERSGFDEAARVFVRKLSDHAEFGTVILPTLFVQHAEVFGSVARWDGSEHDLGLGGEQEGVEPVQVEGLIPAASLHLVIFDARGEKTLENQTGLELLVRVVRAGSGRSAGYALRPRDDLFSDTPALRATLDRALAPYLSP